MLGLAIVLQLLSLKFAPLIIVQPLGAVALVVTAIVNSRISKVKLTRKAIRAIVFSVAGVGLFVAFASPFAKSTPITQNQLATVLILLGVTLVIFAVIFVTLRKRFKAGFYIIGAGVLFGFVATLAKTVIDRLSTISLIGFKPDAFEWLTIGCVVALLAASALGSYFVQSAHAHGPPDLVVAGLTVIDPIVAVTIGIVVLNEMAGAPLWTMFALLIAGAIAIYGVFLLSRVNVPSPEETNTVA